MPETQPLDIHGDPITSETKVQDIPPEERTIDEVAQANLYEAIQDVDAKLKLRFSYVEDDPKEDV